MKKIVSFLLVLALAATLLTGCTVTTKNGVVIDKKAEPADFFKLVCENTNKEYEIPELHTLMALSEALKDGMTVSLALPDGIEEKGIGPVEMKMGLSQKMLCLAGSLDMEEVGKIDLKAYTAVEDKELALSFDMTTTAGVKVGGAYGTKMTGMKEKAENSPIFSLLGIDGAALEEAENKVGVYQKDAEKIKELLEGISDDAIPQTVEKTDNSDKTYDIKVSVKADDVKAFLNNLAGQLDALTLVKDIFSGSASDLTSMLPVDVPEIPYKNMVEAVKDAMKDVKDTEITYHVSKEFVIDKISGSDGELTLAKDGNKLTLEGWFKPEEKKINMTLVYEDGTFSFTGAEEGGETLTAEWKKDGSLSMKKDDEVLNGSLKLSEKELTVAFDELVNDGETEKLGLKMTVTAGSEGMFDKFEYKDIFTMTTQELMQIVAMIGGAGGEDEPTDLGEELAGGFPAPAFGSLIGSEEEDGGTLYTYAGATEQDVIDYLSQLAALGATVVPADEAAAAAQGADFVYGVQMNGQQMAVMGIQGMVMIAVMTGVAPAAA